MTNKSIATALALGFLACTLATLPARAQTDCKWLCGSSDCAAQLGPEYSPQRRVRSEDPLSGCPGADRTYCCRVPVTKTGPVNPCEAEGPDYEYSAKAKGCVKKASTTTPPSTDPALSCPAGQTYNYETKRCNRPIKQNIGKGETPAALISACQKANGRWDEQRRKCIKPSQAKAECEARGPNYTYDLDTGGCKKIIGAKRAPEPAEETSSEQASDESDDDYKPKKGKKKKRHWD